MEDEHVDFLGSLYDSESYQSEIPSGKKLTINVHLLCPTPLRNDKEISPTTTIHYKWNFERSF